MKKSLIGAIGEQMVSVKLMQQGWNVLNACLLYTSDAADEL